MITSDDIVHNFVRKKIIIINLTQLKWVQFMISQIENKKLVEDVQIFVKTFTPWKNNGTSHSFFFSLQKIQILKFECLTRT